MSYDALRHFADSWGLVAMLLLYVAFIGWAFRPGSRHVNDTAARSIFEQDGEDPSHG